MDSINNMNLFGSNSDRDDDSNYDHLPRARVYPASEATTAEAKAQIREYRGYGLLDSELGVTRDFPGGPEEVVIDKAGVIKLAKLSPVGGVEAACRVQALMKEAGATLSVDEELDIVSGGQSA